jgi:hypothetical protein
MENDNKHAELLSGVWDSLTDEQKEKAKACESVDDLIKLAGEEGIELPDEILDAVAGGSLGCGNSGSQMQGQGVVLGHDRSTYRGGSGGCGGDRRSVREIGLGHKTDTGTGDKQSDHVDIL